MIPTHSTIRDKAVESIKADCRRAQGRKAMGRSDEYYNACADAPRHPNDDLADTIVGIVRTQQSPEHIRDMLLTRLFTARAALTSASVVIPPSHCAYADIAKARDQVNGILAMMGAE